ncbi:SMI1/KNR4 family protein [Corynebacterium uberis]|uniref:SMI1/KNR4 family protein n=1 Tax=Corynebacterium TaxID=1716 RepID=UPI001D0A6C3E|nr:MULTISPECIES: SMI1/KNR4 family protein [Corynebacterium]MCZ9309475.1 SMI1/KNR4 family protein [Corynebacterium sp. c6VSa_13]UDL73024.1 SMI1/KNR4 family protein [Corynebacterium uberis]UDL76099.1 SMI1/KNR4 family protein [Corynebacterium uberis]UDL78311.1 SMI1/KNR4 family protein [Corynebacterium uberis]UDL80594.1 SMI1/KNR4 family protein [Corynebacterium uberis]
MSVDFEMVRPGDMPQENCIPQIEALTGARLPADFRAFLEQYDGGVPVTEDVGDMIVLPDPELDASLDRFATSREILEHLQGVEFNPYWAFFSEGVLPFAEGSAVEWGIGVSGAHEGEIVLLHHECAPVSGVAVPADGSASWEMGSPMSFSQLMDALVPLSSLVED